MSIISWRDARDPGNPSPPAAASDAAAAGPGTGGPSDFRLFGAFGDEAHLVPGEGFGRRAAARILDSLVFSLISIVAAFVLALALGIAAAASGVVLEEVPGGGDSALLYAANLFQFLAYFVLFEWLWGSTPGKRMLGMVVVDEDLAPCGFGAALKRNLLYLLEALAWGIPAFLAMRNSPRAQRHGDRWAGTIVPRREAVPPASLGTPARFGLASLAVGALALATAAVGLVGRVQPAGGAARATGMPGGRAFPPVATAEEAAGRAPYALGLEAYLRGDYRAATEQWIAHLATNADDTRGWHALALANTEAGDWGNALNAFQQLATRAPRHPDAWDGAGFALERLKQPAEAMAAYRRQIEVAPRHPRAHKRLGLLLAEGGEWPEAASALDRAASIGPADRETLLALGRARAKLRDGTRAADAFERARRQGGMSFSDLNEIAQFLADEGLALDTAAAWSEAAAAQASSLSEALAIDTLTKADVKRSFGVSWMWYGRGRVAFRAGDFASAERYFRAAHSFRALPVIVRDLGLTLERAGRRPEALPFYAEALVLDPKDAQARGLLELQGFRKPAITAAIAEARRRREERFTVRLGRGSIPGGQAEVLVLFVNGRPGAELRAVTPDPRLEPLLLRAAASTYPIGFPDEVPVRIACWGRLFQDARTGECVLQLAMGLVPPGGS